MPKRKRKILQRVEIVLGDEVPRYLYYTLADVLELQQLPQRDVDSIAVAMFLGLRHEHADLTLETLRPLIEMQNLSYYNACIAEAMGTANPSAEPAAGAEPAQAAAVNGLAVPSFPSGSGSGLSLVSGSGSPSGNSGS
jgi:hypothetical protein